MKDKEILYKKEYKIEKNLQEEEKKYLESLRDEVVEEIIRKKDFLNDYNIEHIDEKPFVSPSVIDKLKKAATRMKRIDFPTIDIRKISLGDVAIVNDAVFTVGSFHCMVRSFESGGDKYESPCWIVTVYFEYHGDSSLNVTSFLLDIKVNKLVIQELVDFLNAFPLEFTAYYNPAGDFRIFQSDFEGSDMEYLIYWKLSSISKVQVVNQINKRIEVSLSMFRNIVCCDSCVSNGWL